MKPVLPKEVVEASSIEEAARRLGTAIDLPGSAPLAATRRALSDPFYARALMATRKFPAIRDRFLSEPVTTSGETPSAAALASKAAGGVLKWGMEGLRPAEPWIIRRRLAACGTCEFQAPAPNTLIYRGARIAVGEGATICRSCHCLINTKAALSTERCPERDPADPSRSRWGEPWIGPGAARDSVARYDLSSADSDSAETMPPRDAEAAMQVPEVAQRRKP